MRDRTSKERSLIAFVTRTVKLAPAAGITRGRLHVRDVICLPSPIRKVHENYSSATNNIIHITQACTLDTLYVTLQ